jgi:hypothetical protein
MAVYKASEIMTLSPGEKRDGLVLAFPMEEIMDLYF